ncbi:unnamed protein product [Diatraea saccharalis]|uniref:Peptidase S1 domain-containing protein n=1 Tax=Diatraea saccharalis TaxID=40085 RepID=A0A9N9RE40_9NEOP|nr:unnamed protein product [Diatraea saccharalis]
MNTFLLLLCFVATVNTEPIKYMRDLLKNNTHKTRRILDGKEVGETRPYMVYLRPGSSSDPNVQDNNWLCGGVIVHERYIITSAACIEDVKQFYVVSGMHRDIAVVKVEDSFNFKRRVRGCDFIPSKIAYNNISEELEKAGTIGSIAGWGSTENFVDVLDVGRATVNSPELLEADVVLLSKKNCKNRWDPRYHSVIDEHMICAKDNMDMDSMSVLCTAQEVNCTELIYSDEDDQEETRRFVVNPKNTLVHTSTCRRLLRATKTQIAETVFDWSIRSHNSSTTDVTHDVTRNNNVITLHVATELPADVQEKLKKTNVTEIRDLLNNSRRIIMGTEAHASRPYMVYLRLPQSNPKYKDYRSWLCGGVIVHEEYILTSAACIEDAKYFYVVSGTFRYNAEEDNYNNPCIKNGAKKAIWKCIPRNYIFDGHENDNIRWMNNDIAVVKVEDEFDFTRRIRGCSFIPKPICYNNQSDRLESPGTVASIAGWGSMERYNEENNVQDLIESDVTIISKNRCKRRWGFSGIEAIEVATELPKKVEVILNETRRIINGDEVTDGRPYMVYLKLPRSNRKQPNYRTWLCGGVIIHEEYILTSAACIEDAEHFYVVSGTYKYADDDDRYNNPCIKNGAKKAIWKCVPKNYVFDGHENDNIRWMNNDIAVVKVEDGFDFTRRIRGCAFVPKPICYNNQSQTLENPGSVVSISGWGTTSRYNDWVNRRKDNQQNLLEAQVEIITKGKCKRRWGSRYHNIIDNYMICTKDIGQTMSEICNEKYVDCQDINYSEEDDLRRDTHVLKTEKIPTNLRLHSAYHNETIGNATINRRTNPHIDGGFCENDHGGPLVYGGGVNAIVIGIISACLVKERTNKCYGPFLYTSVYKNRQFISCALYKEVEPAKNEIDATIPPVVNPEVVNRAHETTVDASGDKVFSGSGFILRAANETSVLTNTNSTTV